MRLLVDDQGKVVDMDAAPTDPVRDGAARETLQGWTFRPAHWGSLPIAAYLDVDIPLSAPSIVRAAANSGSVELLPSHVVCRDALPHLRPTVYDLPFPYSAYDQPFPMVQFEIWCRLALANFQYRRISFPIRLSAYSREFPNAPSLAQNFKLPSRVRQSTPGNYEELFPRMPFAPSFLSLPQLPRPAGVPAYDCIGAGAPTLIHAPPSWYFRVRHPNRPDRIDQ